MKKRNYPAAFFTLATIFVVLFFFCNFSSFSGVLQLILSAILPILLGFSLAFILNLLLRPLERLWNRLFRMKLRRAPDYDDWSLNGDILVWDPILGRALEISSMGIRVDAEAMDRQLTLAGADDRRIYPYHQMILNGTLPLTVGGGIGQSRLCMLLLEKAHIGEVQTSIWPDEMIDACEKNGIILL